MDKTMLWGLARVVFALAIVVPLAVYATRWYGRRHIGSGQSLTVKDSLSLGTNRSLLVVEWDDKRFLLGVTNQSITVIDQRPNPQLTDEEVPE